MALRYQFISTFLLEMGVLARENPSEAEIIEGFKSINSLRILEALAGGQGLQVRLLGFFSPDLNQTIAVEKRANELENKLKQKGEQYVRTTSKSTNI
jgi:hypothetical protein